MIFIDVNVCIILHTYQTDTIYRYYVTCKIFLIYIKKVREQNLHCYNSTKQTRNQAWTIQIRSTKTYYFIFSFLSTISLSNNYNKTLLTE